MNSKLINAHILMDSIITEVDETWVEVVSYPVVAPCWEEEAAFHLHLVAYLAVLVPTSFQLEVGPY